jgi:hypothetical protein
VDLGEAPERKLEPDKVGYPTKRRDSVLREDG